MTRRGKGEPPVYSDWAELAPLVAKIGGDHQADVRMLLTRTLQSIPSSDILRVLDLGCGGGEDFEVVRSIAPSATWVGLDILDSPEVRARAVKKGKMVAYDGVRMPFEDGSVSVVYSRQVLEHVLQPCQLVREVHRVIQPGGVFLGSTSQIEAFHSRSTFLYSPLGLAHLLRSSGFRDVELWPGVDGLSLLVRRIYLSLGGRHLPTFPASRETLVNRSLGWLLRVRGAGAERVGASKLTFAGHVIFRARAK